MMRKRLAAPVLAAAALAIGAGPAGAHGGDAALVHSCIDNAGNVKIVAATATCKQNELPLDWARNAGAAGPTYSAGSGLSLSPTNEFSVTGAPWGGLSDVPAGFADGVDNEGPDLTWGNLTGIPSDLLDGDNDGSAAVGALATQLATDDGVPDQSGDPVSFSKIKDLTTTSGDGRITGEFVRNGSLTAGDLAERTITGSRIATGSIDSDHLAPGVLDRIVTTTSVDANPIVAGDRVAVEVPLAGVDPLDIVVVSPPALLDDGLVFAGSDVLVPGTVTIYLHNITAGAIDPPTQTWTIRQLKTGG